MAEPTRKNKGLTLGLNVRNTWIHLFKENHVKKRTDKELLRFMNKEFPGRDSFEFNDIRGVNNVRNAYNRGVFTAGEVPARPSKRYGRDSSSKN